MGQPLFDGEKWADTARIRGVSPELTKLGRELIDRVSALGEDWPDELTLEYSSGCGESMIDLALTDPDRAACRWKYEIDLVGLPIPTRQRLLD